MQDDYASDLRRYLKMLDLLAGYRRGHLLLNNFTMANFSLGSGLSERGSQHFVEAQGWLGELDVAYALAIDDVDDEDTHQLRQNPRIIEALNALEAEIQGCLQKEQYYLISVVTDEIAAYEQGRLNLGQLARRIETVIAETQKGFPVWADALQDALFTLDDAYARMMSYPEKVLSLDDQQTVNQALDPLKTFIP